MARSPRYYMLMASLPPLPPVFTSDQTPISRLRLERRLALLEPDDRAELAAIEDLMRWDRLPLDITDQEILERAHSFIPQIRSATLREVATWRLEVRTVVAGLRRRALGRPPPSPREPWGYGRWVRYITHNWAATDFGLGGALPWVAEFSRLINQNDTLGFERELLGITWQYMSRAADRHFFTFEAVALYVLRWDIISRWTAYNGRLAQERFDRLVNAGLGEYAELFDTSSATR
ncbi:MAG: DUF2764 family protein [Gemmatimonadota bacterium]|nr:MAG: DUF2764 family protein [Gemmatimonadota bacterium]